MVVKNGVSRRQFLIGLSLAGAGVGVASLYHRSGLNPIVGANDRLRVAVIGLGQRGRRHIWEYLRQPGVEVCALCDVDEQQLRAHVDALLKAGQPRPATFTDYRRIIDSQEIDALSIATPSRWHAPMAIAACEGGKDVFVEKPCATRFMEGKRLVDHAEKYGRIVQQRMGTTFAVSHDSAPLLASPSLGEVRSVKGSRWIYTPADWQAQRNPQASIELVEEAFDELDFARVILDVGLPTHVSTVSMESALKNGSSRVGVRMLFSERGELERAIDFEVIARTLPNVGFGQSRQPGPLSSERDFEGVRGSGPQFESSNTFVTAGGDFTVTSDSRSMEVDPDSSDWANFISCVRRRDMLSSNFPVADAQVSCALLQLAQLSIQHRRSFTFDPRSERALEDTEINAGLAE